MATLFKFLNALLFYVQNIYKGILVPPMALLFAVYKIKCLKSYGDKTQNDAINNYKFAVNFILGVCCK